jgi:hypothetical protein
MENYDKLIKDMQTSLEKSMNRSFLSACWNKNDNFSTCGASANVTSNIGMQDIIDMFKKLEEIKKDRIKCVLVTNQSFIPNDGIFQKEYEGEKYIIMSYSVFYPLQNQLDKREYKCNSFLDSICGIPIYENDELLCRVWVNIPSDTFKFPFKSLDIK